MERKKVIISTDGACSGNHLPGLQPGGWAAILRFGKNMKEIAGFVPSTSNNRMEMQAVIEGIARLKMPCDVTIRTDSQVVCNAIANLENRAKNEWKTKTGATCANVDLHKRIYELKHAGDHQLRYEYVEGHSGDEDNERCDFLAQKAIRTKGEPPEVSNGL